MPAARVGVDDRKPRTPATRSMSVSVRTPRSARPGRTAGRREAVQLLALTFRPEKRGARRPPKGGAGAFSGTVALTMDPGPGDVKVSGTLRDPHSRGGTRRGPPGTGSRESRGQRAHMRTDALCQMRVTDQRLECSVRCAALGQGFLLQRTATARLGRQSAIRLAQPGVDPPGHRGRTAVGDLRVRPAGLDRSHGPAAQISRAFGRNVRVSRIKRFIPLSTNTEHLMTVDRCGMNEDSVQPRPARPEPSQSLPAEPAVSLGVTRHRQPTRAAVPRDNPPFQGLPSPCQPFHAPVEVS